MQDYERLASSVPVPFHWARRGEYRTSALIDDDLSGSDEEDEDEDNEDRLMLRPHSGLYIHEQERTTADPINWLCVGNLVAIDCRDDSTTELRFYIARVIHIDRTKANAVEVHR